MTVFTLTGWVSLVILAFEFVLITFALIDASLRRAEAYPAAEKQNKMFWLIVLGLALAVLTVYREPLGLLSLLGLVAAIVYVVDARPALRSVGKRKGGGNGPHGSW